MGRIEYSGEYRGESDKWCPSIIVCDYNLPQGTNRYPIEMKLHARQIARGDFMAFANSSGSPVDEAPAACSENNRRELRNEELLALHSALRRLRVDPSSFDILIARFKLDFISPDELTNALDMLRIEERMLSPLPLLSFCPPLELASAHSCLRHLLCPPEGGGGGERVIMLLSEIFYGTETSEAGSSSSDGGWGYPPMPDLLQPQEWCLYSPSHRFILLSSVQYISLCRYHTDELAFEYID